MKIKRMNLLEVLGTGFIALVLFCVPLFWMRYFSESSLRVRLGHGVERLDIIEVTPSGLLPESIEKDPNVVSPSSVQGRMNSRGAALYGFWDYYADRMPEGERSNVFYHWRSGDRLYFDERSGLINSISYWQRLPDGTGEHRRVQLCAGPEGISKRADAELGRFFEPVFDRFSNILYDKKHKRFFKLNFRERTVVKGEELDEVPGYKPVKIGWLCAKQSWQKQAGQSSLVKA
ncbi:MAG: hypothetical protein ACYTE8_12250 [Planctomycetota bacterium]|jgi:hypothetical protein